MRGSEREERALGQVWVPFFLDCLGKKRIMELNEKKLRWWC